MVTNDDSLEKLKISLGKYSEAKQNPYDNGSYRIERFRSLRIIDNGCNRYHIRKLGMPQNGELWYAENFHRDFIGLGPSRAVMHGCTVEQRVLQAVSPWNYRDIIVVIIPYTVTVLRKILQNVQRILLTTRHCAYIFRTIDRTRRDLLSFLFDFQVFSWPSFRFCR